VARTIRAFFDEKGERGLFHRRLAIINLSLLASNDSHLKFKILNPSEFLDIFGRLFENFHEK